jgi:hypothetical protein
MASQLNLPPCLQEVEVKNKAILYHVSARPEEEVLLPPLLGSTAASLLAHEKFPSLLFHGDPANATG